ncbi:sensor histidine kinase [Curtobacterium caseinilyticum]|uniref:histidine kinase n=1 Tax=Curtobacterium caseinilyticum TaxID=3055137 RepID=A0ABT7TRY1_9MICO|nr:histidine kinase [Curtobacterium caseinilyticum]MDM7892361.1 histidine kinase [Curtobacterium caseinilyticum]
MQNTTLSSYFRSARGCRLLVDLTVGVAFACVIWTYSLSYDGSVDNGDRAVRAWTGWHLFIPAVTVALVGVRRLVPWPVLAALLAVDWYDRWRSIGSEPFGVAMGLFTIASERPWRQTLVAGGVALSVLVASTQLIGRTTRGFWTCLIVYTFGIVAGLAVRRVQAYRWRVLRLLAQSRIERRTTQRAEERAALALEVHDVCSNSLAVVSRLSEVARSRVAAEPDTAMRLLDDVARVARDGMAEVRRFVRLAESDPVDGDVHAMIARVRAVGVPLTATISGEPRDQRVAATVYRVVQEALTNVLRHAGPDRVELEVRHDQEGGVSLRVLNDGVVATTRGSGRGTRGMAERVATLGGSLRVGPGHEDGTWCVEAVVPPPGGLATAQRRSTVVAR